MRNYIVFGLLTQSYSAQLIIMIMIIIIIMIMIIIQEIYKAPAL